MVHAIKWQLQHRYMQVEAMAELVAPVNEAEARQICGMTALNARWYHANPRKTDCGVDGTYAQRLTGASRSSPEAAQRCAKGAGLCAEHVRQPGGASPLHNLMEVKRERSARASPRGGV